MTEARDSAAVRFPPPLIPLATILLGGVLDRVWPPSVVDGTSALLASAAHSLLNSS